MSHRNNCPSEEYARDRGREEWRSGWYSPYAMGDCYDAQRAYDDGMQEERRAERNRREAREQRDAAEIEAAYNAQMEAEHAAHMDAEMRAAEEAHYAELQAQAEADANR